MEVRHNTSLLEQAVEHVVRRATIPTIRAEAEALHKKARATSFRRLASGGAIALAAVGIGLGLHLGLWETGSPVTNKPVSGPEASIPEEENTGIATTDEGEKTTEAARDEVPAKTTDDRIDADSGPAPSPEPQVVTTDYDKFRSTTFKFHDRTWEIKAGHHFATETDPIWTYAWCYTQQIVDGVSVYVELANRETPSVAPSGPIASRATLEKVGLTEAAALFLATKCAWADWKIYSVRDFRSPGGQSNPFATREAIVVMSGRTLRYDGDIGNDFLATLKKHDFDELQIDSMGGLIIEAMSAGSWLRQSGKSVQVNRYCLSACVLVMAGGKVRAAAETAQIGVHRFYSMAGGGDAGSAMEWAQQTSSEIVSYLERMEVNVALFHAMAAVPSQSMEFIDHDRLRHWNLIGGTEIAVAPLPPSKKSDNGLTEKNGSDGIVTFTELDGFDAVGHDLVGMPTYKISLEQCKAECSSNPKCRALTYNRTAIACFLKEKATVIVGNEKAFTAYDKKLEGGLQFSKLAFYQDSALTGETYRKENDVGYVDCILICEKDAKCSGFSFDRRRRVCTLMDFVVGQTRSLESSSGEKQLAD